MASKIDPVLAKSLIKEFQNQNTSTGGPALKTHDGPFITGYFIDRQSIEAVLSNPNVVGVSVHFAKHPDAVGSKDNIFTLVFAGAEPNSKPGALSPHMNTGDIYEQLMPCPPYCTDL